MSARTAGDPPGRTGILHRFFSQGGGGCPGDAGGDRADAAAGLAPQAPLRRWDWVRVCGCLLIVACAIGMAWRYQVPSMWVDEILVALSTRLDVADIVRRYWYQDFHPPYYALLLKGLSLLNDSDVFLRLPSLVCAVSGLLVGFTLALRWGNTVGACYLALCLGNLWIWLFARQVRPYGLTILLATYAFFTALDIARSRRVNAVAYSLANMLLLLVHYGNVLIVLPQYLLVAYAYAKDKSPRARRVLIALSVACAVGLAAVLPSYLATPDVWNAPKPPVVRTERFLLNLVSIVTGAPSVEPGAALAVGGIVVSILVLGLVGLARERRQAGLFAAAFLLIPSLYIVLPSRQYGEFQAWHLAMILPALLFGLSRGISRLPLPGLCILAILGCGLANIHDKAFILYTEHGSKGIYKTVAGMIADQDRGDAVFSLSHDITWNSTQWYLSHLHPAVSLYKTRLAPDQERVRLVYISGATALPGLNDGEEGPVERAFFADTTPRVFSFKTQRAFGQKDEYVLRWYEKLIERPLVNALRPGETLDISRDPAVLLGRCRELERVGLKPNIIPVDPGCQAGAFYFFPADPGAPGRVSFLFDNQAGAARADFAVRYFLSAPGEVACSVSIDGGPPEEVFADQTPAPREKTAAFRRELKPGQRIEVIVSLRSLPFPYLGVFPSARIGLNGVAVRSHGLGDQP